MVNQAICPLMLPFQMHFAVNTVFDVRISSPKLMLRTSAFR